MVSVSSLRRYASADVVVHVLALRVNTDRPCDVVVSDYTANTQIDENSHRTTWPGPPQLQLHLQIARDKLVAFADAYTARFAAQLFLPADVDLSQLTWIDVKPVCLARVTLTAKTVSTCLTGTVRGLSVVESVPDALRPDLDALWTAVLAHCPDRVAGAMDSVSSAIFPLLLDEQRQQTLRVAENSGYRGVKQEPQEDLVKLELHLKLEEELADAEKLQATLRNLLPAVSQPGQRAVASQLLTQFSPTLDDAGPTESLWLLESQSELQPSHHASQIFSQHTSMRPDQRKVLDKAKRPFAHLIKALSKLPMASHSGRTYSTSAYIVGSIPHDLSLLCTKRCEERNGTVCNSDPKVEPLELIVTDAAPGELSTTEYISVYVPRAHVGHFFGFPDVEQLYISPQKVNELFARLFQGKKQLHLDVAPEELDGRHVWTLKRSTLAQLLGQR